MYGKSCFSPYPISILDPHAPLFLRAGEERERRINEKAKRQKIPCLECGPDLLRCSIPDLSVRRALPLDQYSDFSKTYLCSRHTNLRRCSPLTPWNLLGELKSQTSLSSSSRKCQNRDVQEGFRCVQGLDVRLDELGRGTLFILTERVVEDHVFTGY